MDININPYLKNFIEQQVNSGKYTNADDVIEDALRLLEEENEDEDSLAEKKLDLPIINERINIQKFSIYGLFGTSNVHIKFKNNVKILIGENGLGKTQVLNIFYYTLTTNFAKLSKFPFEKVELKLNNETVGITKKEINDYLKKQFQYTYNITDRNDKITADFSSVLDKIQNLEKILESEVKLDLITKRSKKIPPKLKDFNQKIQENLSECEILYFPTFRRVEEDLHSLGYDEKKFFLKKEDTRLIHFGMDDVQKRFDAIEKKIDLLLKEGFTEISSEILSKLVKGFGDTNKEEVLNKINEKNIDVILARAGNQITDADKARIREIVLNKEEISGTDNSLFYFIQILIDIYEKQKQFDNSINEFKDVCNGYLIGKQVFYDESNIKIFIKSDDSNKHLPLSKLSSGEKQIISIFSTIYLSEIERKFIVLFDEPELSLSMIWQQKLLLDIINSKKCNFLLAVTHSPFIFDKLGQYAIGLNQYVEPSKTVTA